jgi:MFS family permease
LRANLAQFCLLVAVNALVGGMVGQQQTVLPLLATQHFQLTGYSVLLTYVFAFGITKAATNYVAGACSDRFGRKPVLLLGWLIAIPVPLLLIWAPSWGWVVVANVLLGLSQGLTWSTTVIMKIDLVGARHRGLAMGLNEAAGYIAVSLTALATGYIASRYGLRPEPFYLGVAFAGLGLGLSALAVKETSGHALHEARSHDGDLSRTTLNTGEVFWETTYKNPSLSAASQAGLVNNLNDGMAWGLLPIFYAASGLTVTQIGILAALYPAVWGVGQLVTGAWSDYIGRKPLIVAGMWIQAAAIAVIASSTTFPAWASASIILGVGTALVYPTLLAAVGDLAPPTWRATAVGVYRFWRDFGFAVGALLTGVIADLTQPGTAIWTVAVLTFLSGVIVATRMAETRARAQSGP